MFTMKTRTPFGKLCRRIAFATAVVMTVSIPAKHAVEYFASDTQTKKYSHKHVQKSFFGDKTTYFSKAQLATYRAARKTGAVFVCIFVGFLLVGWGYEASARKSTMSEQT
jgi:hypothetical protein